MNTRKNILLIALIILCSSAFGQSNNFKPSKVDYDSYEKLVLKVKQHRKQRLIPLDTFLKYSLDSNTLILDTRSPSMYAKRHIKGSVNLNFSEFTQENLRKVCKDESKRILIYCNNNIEGDEEHFPTKGVLFPKGQNIKGKELLLALNVPTFISLYGYGYTNVYELSELVNISDKRVEFEGTAATKSVLNP